MSGWGPGQHGGAKKDQSVDPWSWQALFGEDQTEAFFFNIREVADGLALSLSRTVLARPCHGNAKSMTLRMKFQL